MTISGVVITLATGSSAANRAIEALRGQAEIEIGERHGNRLSLVLDSHGREHDSQVWDWMQALDGVEQAQLVFVADDDVSRPSSGSGPAEVQNG